MDELNEKVNGTEPIEENTGSPAESEVSEVTAPSPEEENATAEDPAVTEGADDVASESGTEEAAEPSEMTEAADQAPAEPTEKPIWSFAAQAAADKAAAKKSGRRGALAYAIVMTCLFAVCFAILAVLLVTGFGNGDNTVYVDGDTAVLADLVDSVKDSVVTVSVTTESGSGFGSGFVYTSDGYIITNYHVIDDATSIYVICSDGRELTAEFIDGDELSDVAVIFVRNLGLEPLAIGDSDALRVGEDVIAIGTPVDLEYAGTVTKGIVSGVKRVVRVYESSGLLEKSMEMIQTDTTLNHGNSGGPLINMRGEVVGINTMKYYASDAGDTLYFSIQINDAVAIAEDIIEDGTYSGNKGSATQGVQLGITCGTVYKDQRVEVAQGVFITPESDGVIVTGVSAGYPCEGKLELYDIIVSFDGVKTPTVDRMRSELFKHKVGDTVVLEVWRNGQLIKVEITL